MKLKEIVETLHGQGYTAEQIAKRLFKSVATIRKYLPRQAKEKFIRTPREPLNLALFIERAPLTPVDDLIAQFGRPEQHLRRLATKHGITLVRRPRKQTPFRPSEKAVKMIETIRTLASQGKHQNEIARLMGIERATVAKYKKRYGIEIAKAYAPSPAEKPLEGKDLAAELRKAGSIKKLAKQIGIPVPTVSKYLAKNGVVSTNKGGALQHEKRPTTDKVSALRAGGMSVDEIAQQTGLSKATVYEYISRAKGNRKPLWKKPPGYKPKSKKE
ncbi:helix-turn-helix domain-containing protein [Spirosoma sp. KUDC1026]|uniref:helix-turn-helix domain-containing protein n=1 Tax=Spirosoma sp. KUDC1026 TaxID=2745947 RepID=UPI00159BAA73|nr:helix-turn-helix domain-containing protein [Spirosoma sp. KUDC1026]QKZ15172.1 helix-turn-helix domain-containing protein [Spirosoma sp. KUDC1026]